jgi:hypothetical protein
MSLRCPRPLRELTVEVARELFVTLRQTVHNMDALLRGVHRHYNSWDHNIDDG